jgi:chromosome segregation ATPase
MKSSTREFKFMSKDVDAIIKGFKNNKVTEQLKGSHQKLHELLDSMKRVEKKLGSTSSQAKDLKENLHKGHKFMDAYEKVFASLPDE